MASDEDAAGLFTPDEYDAEIERLKLDKAARIQELKEPKQKRRRQVRRAQILGRAYVQLYVVDPKLLARAREHAGDDEGWLFGEWLLGSDGWSPQQNGNYAPPELSLDDLNDKTLDKD